MDGMDISQTTRNTRAPGGANKQIISASKHCNAGPKKTEMIIELNCILGRMESENSDFLLEEC